MNIQPVSGIKVSNTQQANFNNSNSLVSFKGDNKSDSVELSNKENKTEKKNIGKYIALGLAGAAAIGVGIYAIIKPHKASKVAEAAKDSAETIKEGTDKVVSDFEKGIKKFFDKDNKLIEGAKLEKGKALNSDGSAFSGIMKTMNDKGKEVTLEYVDGHIVKKFFGKDNKLIEGAKLEKGKALNSDGSAFSGIMKTMNGKGEEIALEYVDGYIAKSTINGETSKIFENISVYGKALSRDKGVNIIKCGKDNNVITHLLHDNGKIKRTYNQGTHTGLEFSKAGKKISEFKDDGGLIIGKVFDENGKIVKEFANKNGTKSVAYYNSNGEKTKEVFGGQYKNTLDSSSFHIIADDSIANLEVKPNEINYYSNGALEKYLSVSQDDLNLEIGDMGYSIRFPKGVPTLEKADSSANLIRFDMDMGNSNEKRWQTACIDGFRQPPKNPKFQFTQSKWQDYMKNITEALNTAKAEGMSYDSDKVLEFLKKFQPTF